MTPEQLQAILAKRTPGRYIFRHYDRSRLVFIDCDTDTGPSPVANKVTKHDAAAIVAAVNLIGPALAVVEAARDGHGICSCAAMTGGEGPRPIGEGRVYHYQGCDNDDGLTAALAAFDAALEAE